MDDASEEDRSAETSPVAGADRDPPVDDGRTTEQHEDPPWRGDPDEVDGDATDDDGNVFGPRPDEPRRGPILPGDPELENLAFVLLGVATSLVLIADLVGLL
jgi:hypothetical protein